MCEDLNFPDLVTEFGYGDVDWAKVEKLLEDIPGMTRIRDGDTTTIVPDDHPIAVQHRAGTRRRTRIWHAALGAALFTAAVLVAYFSADPMGPARWFWMPAGIVGAVLIYVGPQVREATP